MTSDKQAQANRRNALRSTGPKTPEGKAAVRHNATKHGLLSQEVLLPGEDAATLQELGERLRALRRLAWACLSLVMVTPSYCFRYNPEEIVR